MAKVCGYRPLRMHLQAMRRLGTGQSHFPLSSLKLAEFFHTVCWIDDTGLPDFLKALQHEKLCLFVIRWEIYDFQYNSRFLFAMSHTLLKLA